MTREETWQKLVGLHVVTGNMPNKQWNLCEANLRNINFDGADFSGANLFKASFRFSSLVKANFKGAILIGADFVQANLLGANLSNTNLRGANLRVCNLEGADLSDSKLFRTDLSLSIFRGANFSNAELVEAALVEADLTEANISGACIDNANLSRWIVKDIVCTHIVQFKNGYGRLINFAPREFEKKYTQISNVVELILKIPLNDSASFIGTFIAESINRCKKSSVVAWKGVEALSDDNIKLAFIIFDNAFYIDQKNTIEETLKDALNDYFKKNPLGESHSYGLDPLQDATGNLISIKKVISIPGTPLEIHTPILQEKALSYFIKMGKLGEDIMNIVTSIFP